MHISAREGDRVRVTGIMNDPQPLEVGLEGTVEMVTQPMYGMSGQICVKWDNGRGLILLDTDPYMIVKRKEETAGADQG